MANEERSTTDTAQDAALALRAVNEFSANADIQKEFGNVSDYHEFLKAQEAGGAVPHFEGLVKDYQDAHGCTRGKAIAAVAREHPVAHRFYIEAAQGGNHGE